MEVLIMEDIIKNENIEETENKVDEPIKEEVKTFTQDEVNAMITKRLEREKKNAEIEKQEAEKLAKLSESDRQKAIFEKQSKELEESKLSFQNERLKFEAVKIMTEKQVPITFIDMLVAKDAETTYTNIDTFKNNFDAAVQKAVEERFKGGGREVNNSTGTKQSGVNPYKKESYSLTQQGILEKNDPTLAAQLRAAAK
jgi:uncharacterized membrane-anchored protein YjiN (DUF445 family)